VSLLGKTVDRHAILDMKNAGIDASWEEGEYHTLVTGGPLMSSPIRIESKGWVVRNGYCFLDIEAMN
jgi:diphthamide synthase (EF-2-diphthine--ammonia ligase)